MRRLNGVLERALETPFYRRKLARSPHRLRSLEQLRALPVTTKGEILADVAAHPPYGSRLRVDRRAIRHVVTTSGTSGAGEEVYPLDAEDEAELHRMAARGFAWAGVEAGSVVLNTLPLSTSAAGQWYHGGLRLLGANVLEVGTYPTERKLDYLERFGADTVVATPSYLLRMALVAAERGRPAAELGVARLVAAGESWSEAWLQRLQELWGAPLYEQYGSTQRAMAWSCPLGALPDGRRGILHALSDHGVYEVVDRETGEPVEDGPGELVVTPFVSSASPLVRFATGDRVVAARGCACGRPGPFLLAGATDRWDFMVKVRGVNVWPEALDRAVFAVPGVREYAARVESGDDGREVLRVEVEVAEPDPDAPERVAQAIRDVVGLTAAVDAVAEGVVTGGIHANFVKRRRLLDLRKAG